MIRIETIGLEFVSIAWKEAHCHPENENFFDSKSLYIKLPERFCPGTDFTKVLKAYRRFLQLSDSRQTWHLLTK
jgi:hypothetical protein